MTRVLKGDCGTAVEGLELLCASTQGSLNLFEVDASNDSSSRTFDVRYKNNQEELIPHLIPLYRHLACSLYLHTDFICSKSSLESRAAFQVVPCLLS